MGAAMPFIDDINKILRDHQGYSGDGKGGDGSLPTGDRTTARKPIDKRDLRELMIKIAQTMGDIGALDYLVQQGIDAAGSANTAVAAAASLGAKIYKGSAAGVAATAAGEYFYTVNLGGGLDVWQNTAGSAVFQATIGDAPLAKMYSDLAVSSAISAALYDPTLRYSSTQNLLSSTRGPAGVGATWQAGRFLYQEAGASASNHHLLTSPGGVKLYAKMLDDGFPAESVRGVLDTDKHVLEKACAIAAGMAYGDTSNGGAQQRTVTVLLEPGREYNFGADTLSIPVGVLNFNIASIGGRATIKGTGLGLDFSRVRNVTFENINFQGFSTATRWKTDNVDGNLIEYNRCWFIECDLGVDTTGYAESRSTVLVFNDCRASQTKQIVKSYCDFLIFNDGHMRNGDPDGAFIYADSQLVINGGIWTPYAAGATARWIDIDNRASTARGSRSATLNTVRFGPEGSGGIPIIYSWLDGDTAAGTRTTLTHISLNNCYAGSNNSTTPRALIVLMDNDAGTATRAPNAINIRGGSNNGAAGMVVTRSGLPVALTAGQFSINIDDAAQTRWGSVNVAPSTPLVEAMLEVYVSHWRHEGFTITSTGAITPSIGTRKVARFAGGSATTVTNLMDALDGHIVTLIFRNANVTIKDVSTGGSFVLKAGVDFVGSNYATLVVVWDRSSARWIEV